MMRIILVIILSLQAAAHSAQTCHTEPVKIGFAKAGIVSFENEVSYAELLEIGADFVCFRVNLKDKVKGDYVSMAGKTRLVNSLK